MSKTVGTVLKVAGAALMVYATGGGSLAMFGAQFGAAAIGVAGAVATAAGTLMAPRTSGAMNDQGAVLRMQTDPTAPRRILYGQAATGGTLVFRDTVGADNTDLHMVIALAGHEIDGITGLKFGDKSISFTGSGALAISGQYASNLSVNIHHGEDDQLAASSLVAASPQWTSNHRLCGVAYAHVKAIWDQDVFPQGMEGFLFTIKGRKIYDPRKDGSIGGVGAHRINDENTWEWSDNPVLCMVDYLLGVRTGGKLVAGVGVDPSRIDWPNIMAEAIICEDDVVLKSGATEQRYTANGWIDPSKSHRENLAALGSACGGTIVFQGGKWRAYVAVPRTVVKSRSSDDVVGAISLQAKKSSASKINCVRGVYADPDADYQLKDFPPIQVQTYVDVDGGQELWTDLNLPMTKSPSMAQRLSKIALGRARMEKSLTGVFSLAALQDQAMDAVSFSHDRFNFINQKMLVTDWQLTTSTTRDGSDALAIQCSLLEEDDLIYDWSNALDEADVTLPGTVVTPDRRYTPLEDLPGKVAWQTQVWGAGKPADYADVTIEQAADIITRQATPPAHKPGRIWVDLTTEDIERSDGTTWHRLGSGDALRLSNAPLEAGANVTETRTSADTSAVYGKAASAVKDAAVNTEKLLANDATVIVHKTSIPADLSGIGTFIMDGLQVTGSVTYINTTELQIGDNIMLLNADEVGAPSQNAGIEIERGTSANVSFIWDEGNDRWSFDQPVYMGAGAKVFGSLNLLNGGLSAIISTTYNGYSSGYHGVLIGGTGTNGNIYLGVDLTGNPSGAFNGTNQTFIPNNKPIMAPNAANNGYVSIIGVNTSNLVTLDHNGNGTNLGGDLWISSLQAFGRSGSYVYAYAPIHMASRSIDYCAQLHMDNNLRFVPSNAYTMDLQSGHASTSSMRLLSAAGVHGWLYADTGAIGFLNSGGNWSVRCNVDGTTELRYSNSTRIQTTSAGVTVTGTGTATDWTATSDRRLKKAIRPLLDSLARIMAMRPVTHEWRKEKGPEGRFYALIAQELQLIEPSLVVEDESGFLSINYAKITPLLIGAIQDQQAQLDSQEARIAKLEGWPMPASALVGVPFPTTTAPVSLRGNDDQYSIMGFFGPLITGPYGRAEAPRLLEYLKGGEFVPNVAANSGVPSAAPLSMLDLLGASAALQITDLPNKSITRDPVPQVANTWYYCQWGFQLKNGVDCTDHTYKHGEFKWVETGVNFQANGNTASDVSNASDASYLTTNASHAIGIGVYTGSSGQFLNAVTRTSTLTLHARSVIDSGYSTSVSCSTALTILPNSTM